MIVRAKISVPHAHGLVPRKRLAPRLALKGARQVVWVVGPPGAGKTSLAIDHLQRTGATHAWLQLDAGDGDPATCFTYLGEALRRATRRLKPSLPAFGPEYGQALPAFSRRFFEAFFARLAPGSILVLDNYQDLPAGAPTHGLFQIALAVLPPGVQVLVLSRKAPPPAFARFRVDGKLEVLDWDDLRMQEGEAKALLRLRTGAGRAGAHLEELCRLAGGWPAGLVLMAEGGEPSPRLKERSREALFDYFASEVLERAEPEQQVLLLRSSVLHRCTAAQARALTGLEGAGGILKGLARTGYFTVAHGHADPVYEFHPLFREFLRHRAQEILAGDWKGLLLEAGGLQEREGAYSEAFELYGEAGAVGRQAGLISEQAPAMLAQGQHRTLLGWLRSLPVPLVLGDARLSLWLGSCLMTTDLQESRGHLERAFSAFEGDLAGQLLAWCAVVDTWLYAWDDYSRLDPWIRWMDEHGGDFEALDPGTAEAVAVCMVWAVIHRQPAHPEVRTWIRRAERILEEGSHPQLRLRAGTAAFMHHFWAGEQVACEVLVAGIRRLARSLQEPMALITSYWVEVGMLTWNRATPQDCRGLIEAGLSLGEGFGIHYFDFMFHGHAAALAIGAGELEEAGRALAAMKAFVPGRNGWAFFHYLASWEAFIRRDLAAAVAHAEESVACAEASGMPTSAAMNHLVLAELYFEADRREESQVQAGLAEALLERARSPLIEMMFHQGMARFGLRASPRDPAALEHLRRALALGREHGFVNHHWQVAEWMVELCSTALEEGIEVEFVHRLIHALGLKPSASWLQPAWPRELRIETLGRFAIRRGGKDLVFPAKAPWKVLLLLKALVAAGPAGIGGRRLADWLWPEADGDTAQQSLETGLHRLRQLLGVEGIVLVRDGRLGLEPSRCWVDAHAFESMLEAPGCGERALDLYGGAFLEDLDQPWARHYRERLEDRFLKGVLALGQRLEEGGDPEGAVAWYEKGIRAVPLAESLYRRLMVCHGALGDRAEGLRIYERCRTALMSSMEVEPSVETMRVASSLRG